MKTIAGLHGLRVYLDANIVIYFLNSTPVAGDVLLRLFEAIDDKALMAITSELTLAEVLVKPFRDRNPSEVARCRGLLTSRPSQAIIGVSRSVLSESARLRAATRLRLPDAIHAATAILSGCDVLLTNDARFARSGLALDVMLLSDLTS